MKTHRFTCTLCGKPWKMMGDNPEGHTEVPCPKCLKQTWDHFRAELRYVEFALPRGCIEVPPELKSLGLGCDELCLRLAAYRISANLDGLLGPPTSTLQ